MTIVETILIVVVAALGSGGVASWLQLRTTGKRDRAETDKISTEAQGIIISNLQSENKRMSKELEDLRYEVAELRGHLQAMERLKVDQIADAVVNKLVGDDTISLEKNGSY